ncbi:MAG TPA: zf-TFIIB domain-containing protein [Tepidisphaeraceae bacterium]|jgi:Zn-finger nucleic acid-binding protein|nr:zf-TFIIB domain-containing protein [Tepidisphaeraceae bacterium]
MDAGTLNCPSCGAAVPKDAVECQYCHAALETVACPKCMGMMFVGTKFCPHCGAAAEAVAPGTPTKHPCPRCDQPLTTVQVAKMPLEECMHCGGLWVSVATFDRICADSEAQAAASGLQLPPAPAATFDAKIHYIKCPQCTTLMNRKNYAEHSGIIVNVCRAHGVWLDRDEIRRIIEFVRGGGLDRARRAEVEELERAGTSFAASSSLDLAGSTYSDLSPRQSDHLLMGLAAATNLLFGN